MRRGLRWIGWIGWVFASVAAPFFAGRAIATGWAWATWPLTPGPTALYPPDSVSNGEALAAGWMTWGGITSILGLVVLFAGVFAFGAARLPTVRSMPRRYPAILVWLLALAQAAFWSFMMIRADPYWDVLIVVPA